MLLIHIRYLIVNLLILIHKENKFFKIFFGDLYEEIFNHKYNED